MSKSVLVIDTPKTCRDCDLFQKTENDEWCGFDKDAVDPMFRADYCPLKPMPQKCGSARKDDEVSKLIALGWNVCIDYLEEER